MTMLERIEEYAGYEVARTDYGDGYDAYGWIVVVYEGNAGLIQYSHCSCFGTWDGGVGDKWDWFGPVADFVEFAREMRDPHMPDRKLIEKDAGYTDLRDIYSEFLKWAAKEGLYEASAE